MIKSILTLLIAVGLLSLSAQQADSANKNTTGANRANSTTNSAAGVPDKADKNALGVARPLPAAAFTDTVKIASQLKLAK